MPDPYMPRFLAREGRILPGEKRVVAVANPAAGAGWSVTVPGGRQWRIQGGVALLTTDAVVANRIPQITLSDQTTTWWDASVDVNIPASTPQRFSFGALGVPGAAQTPGDAIIVPLPDMFLPAGTQLAAITTAEDVGDQWTGIALMVEECWLDDQMLSTLSIQGDAAIAASIAAEHGQKGA